jgi:hypothetical protein
MRSEVLHPKKRHTFRSSSQEVSDRSSCFPATQNGQGIALIECSNCTVEYRLRTGEPASPDYDAEVD